MISDVKINRFISQLINQVRNEHIFDQITEDWKRNYDSYKGRWDTPARRKLGIVVKTIFRESFPDQDANSSLYIEGEGVPSLWKKPRNLFGSAGVYPDLAILSPLRIAFEFDHSGRGSGLKMALAKAAFNYLSGEYDYCFLFFFDQSGKLNVDGEKETEICRIYEEQFHTKLVMFHKA